MVKYALATNQNPECFSGLTELSLRHAMAVGSKKLRQVKDVAISTGNLIVYDPGRRRMLGQPGLSAIYGLVPTGQSEANVRDRHRNNFLLVTRLRVREELNDALIEAKMQALRESDPDWEKPFLESFEDY